MPFRSKAQVAKFYATPSLHRYISEFKAGTDFSKLPERVKKRKHRRPLHGLSKLGGNG